MYGIVITNTKTNTKIDTIVSEIKELRNAKNYFKKFLEKKGLSEDIVLEAVENCKIILNNNNYSIVEKHCNN